MATIYDAELGEVVEKTAEKLKNIKEIKRPEWALFVKTGAHKERPPENRDWWYIRAASILKTIYLMGPIGVSKLRSRYGGKKNRGAMPEKFYKGSGSIIRKILQQLEKAELVKQGEKGVHKGRIITAKGKSFLDKIASEIRNGSAKSVKQPKEKKEEAGKVKGKAEKEKKAKTPETPKAESADAAKSKSSSESENKKGKEETAKEKKEEKD